MSRISKYLRAGVSLVLCFVLLFVMIPNGGNSVSAETYSMMTINISFRNDDEQMSNYVFCTVN